MEEALFIAVVSVLSICAVTLGLSVAFGDGSLAVPAVVVGVALGMFTLVPYFAVSGSTATPERHAQRLVTASGVPTFTFHCPPGMWERTKNLTNTWNDDAGTKAEKDDKALRVQAAKVETRQGMTTVSLTGAEMVDYLKALDWHAHGARFLPVRDKDPFAVRMYAAITAQIDKIETGQSGAMPKNVDITVNDGDQALTAR